MLILTRRTTETILLIDGDDREIRVTVRAVNAGHVKIGVDAPEEVQILREELTQHTE